MGGRASRKQASVFERRRLACAAAAPAAAPAAASGAGTVVDSGLAEGSRGSKRITDTEGESGATIRA